MKTSLMQLLLVLTCLGIAWADDSSAQELLDQQVTVTAVQQRIKDVLKQIESQTDLHFSYSPQLIRANQAVSISAQNKPLKQILSQLLTPLHIKYDLRGRQIILSPTLTTESTPSSLQVYPQDRPIEGTVRDENGSGLPGVTVLVKGTSIGTTTNASGSYTINVPDNATTLTFSYVGYAAQDMPIGNKQTIDLALVPESKGLEELVVVGYGVQKKVNVTGAISVIENKDITQRPVGQLSTALQGSAPGVTITQGSGQPGRDGGTINIRGIGSNGSNAPLVLVDGIQYNINDVDPNDVESISVLKDAASSSIYGVRAANGVLLITTKRGKSGDTKLSYSNYFGWQSPTRMPNFVGAQNYMRLVNRLNTNSGGSPLFTDTQINAYNDPNRNLDQYADNYWLGEILQGSGFQQNHSLSLAGGSTKTKYRFSTNYLDQNGLLKNTGFKRLTVRLNTDTDISEKLNFSADISARIQNRTEPQSGNGSNGDAMWYQFSQAFLLNPTQVIRYSDGTWGKGRDGNPIRVQDEGYKYRYNSNLMTGNFRLNYKPVDGLTLSGIASAFYDAGYNSYRNQSFNYTDFFTREPNYSQGIVNLTKAYTGRWQTNFQGLADYKKTIGDHSFGVLIGGSSLLEHYDNLTGYRRDITGSLEELNAGNVDGQTTGGTAWEYALYSYFGRLNYSYKDKYLIEANLRRDGSSRFRNGLRWGTFPSFSVGWRISGEEFMKSQNLFADLKLRASWGQLGNHNVLPLNSGEPNNYPYQTTISLNGYSYPFNGVMNPGAALEVYPNDQLTWEISQTADIGLDGSLLKGKLNFSFDYYIKDTKNLLYNLPIPSSVGLTAPSQNVGTLQNKGWEFALNYRDKTSGDFTYGIGFNLADVRNKFTDLKGVTLITQDNDNRVVTSREGYPIGAFFGYQAEGLFQSQEEINNSPTQPGNVAPGDIKFKDLNGDGVINASDRMVIGSNIPRFTYGINLNAAYKGFDLTAFFQGVAKVDLNTVAIKKAPTNADGNFREIHLDSWTPDNPDASFPRLSTGNFNYVSSSYWIESGAYLRLKTLQLGYTLPSSVSKKVGMSRARAFVGGQNLFTFTKLQNDIDPESPNDTRYYPQVKVYTFGFNFDF